MTPETKLAFRIGRALHMKVQPKESVHVVKLPMHNDKFVYEYVIRDDEYRASTAYSHSFFDTDDPKWLARTVYVELQQRIEWARKGKPNGNIASQSAKEAKPSRKGK